MRCYSARWRDAVRMDSFFVMIIESRKSRRTEGSTLFTSLGLLCIVAIALGALVKGVQQESRMTERMIVWKAALPIAEAGVDEALAHLNSTFTLQTNGWTYDNASGTYRKQRILAEGHFEVAIATNTPPTIRSTGWVRAPLQTNYISRSVEVETKIRRSAGIEVKEDIDCGSTGILDSFDSSDPNYSTDKQYDPAKAKDNCRLCTISGAKQAVDVGSRKVYGRIAMGAGGVPGIGNRGKVGSTEWINQGNTSGKIEPGRLSDNFTAKFPPVVAPFTSGLKPASGKVGGVSYEYIFGTGDYSVDKFTLVGFQKALVSGNARVYVSDTMSTTASATIVIEPGAKLELYCAAKSVSIGGQGFLNLAGTAETLQIFALPSVTTLSFQGSSDMIGVIYAPDSNVKVAGSSVFIGHIKARSADVSGNSTFHADEALGTPIYVLASWKEL